MAIIRLFIIALFFTSAVAEARMYQWKDPDTGTTQLSGKPPAWYRTGEAGPRIIVFDKGKIIDDTGISISNEMRESLRQEALLNAEESREEAMRMAVQAEEMKARINMTATEDAPLAREEQLDDIEIPGESGNSLDMQPGMDALTEEQMRGLISEWEKQVTEEARKKAGIDLENNQSP